MNLRHFIHGILALFFMFCFNLSHAQTTSPSAPTQPVSIPAPVVAPPVVTPTTSPTLTPAQKAELAKYEEYQSYCRSNDFDESTAFSNEEKIQKITKLQEQVKIEPNNNLVKVELIKEYAKQNKFKQAEDLFASIKTKLSPLGVATLSAELDVSHKSYRTAGATLEKFLETKPNNTVALLALANIYKLQKNYFEAKAALVDLQKLTLKTDYSIALCEIYALDAHHKDTEDTCALASKRNPEDPLPFVYLGISYREQGLEKESLQAFKNSLKIKKTEFALSCLGEMYTLKKDYKNALTYFKQSTEQNKYSYRAQLGLALSYFELAQHQEALGAFKEACRLGKKDTLEMRKAYKALNDMKSALAATYYAEIQRCNEFN